MRENRYLAQLISDYNKYKRFSKSTRLFSSEEEMNELASKIDPELLQEFVSVFEERYKNMGIDPTDLPNDVLLKDMALVSLVASGKCDPRGGYDKCKDLVNKIVEETKSVSYSRMHRSFSIMKIADSTWGRTGKRLALGLMGVNIGMAKVLKSKEPNKTMEDVVNNRAVAVSVANPELSYHRTGEGVPQNEQQLIDAIVKERGQDLLYAYTIVYTAVGEVPESKLTEEEATIKIYKSVKKIYNYLLRHNRKLNIRGLSSSVTQEEEPRNIIVGNQDISREDILNFLSMMMASKAINNVYTRGGAFEVIFLDHNRNETNEVTSTIYLSADTKDGKKHYIIELDEIRLANINNPKIKDGSVTMDYSSATNHFYIQFPVGLEKGSVGGVFAPMFEVVARVSIGKPVTNTSQATVQPGTSNRYLKNKRLFNKKKKYDWM